MEPRAVEAVVVAFPTLAAYLLVLAGFALVAILIWGGKKVLARLDSQDKTMEDIRMLLASEVQKLREMQHAIDIRVTRIESHCSVVHMFKDRHGNAIPDGH